jgi:hypothetical protein
MRDSLALALVRAELCRVHAQNVPGAASRRSRGMRHVFGKMLRPWRQASRTAPREAALRDDGRGSGRRFGGV